MKIRAGTLQYFAECLIAHLNRDPKNEDERQQIEAEKKGLRDAFIRMASTPPTVDYNTIREAYRRRNGYWRGGVKVEPEPLPDLPPGKARVRIFGA